jgi:uncharacterized protein with GYD domain
MATYLVLGQFTEQGIRNVKDSPKRAEGVKAAAAKVGATVKAVYWTMGPYDIATIVEAPDDTTISAFLLGVGTLGNVRTQCMRAFTSEEVGAILARM